MSARRVALAWHELYLWHDTSTSAGPLDGSQPWIEPGPYGEGPDSRRRLKSLIDASGLSETLVALSPDPADDEELLSAHARDYVAHVASVSRSGGGLVGPNVPIGARGAEIARLAAGGAIAATDAVCSGRARHAYALVRPPGHHAEAGRGMGNCVFNNVAVAALRALRHWSAERVAIVDWDVHHGNGTESIFYKDPRVLTVSLHQDDWYPRGRGGVTDRGEGPGIDRNVNIPLPAGSGAGAYLAAVEELVVPAICHHRPDIVFVACGYDASAMDPYGRMLLHSAAFAALTHKLMLAADALCDGRLVLTHEGGYAPLYVPFCGLAVLEQLTGCSTGVEDPFLARYEGAFQRIQPAQRSAIDAVRAALPTHWT